MVTEHQVTRIFGNYRERKEKSKENKEILANLKKQSAELLLLELKSYKMWNFAIRTFVKPCGTGAAASINLGQRVHLHPSI